MNYGYFRWFFKDKPIVSGGRYAIAVEGKNHSLIVKKSVPEDTGTYGLQIGQDTTKAFVTVVGEHSNVSMVHV